MKKACLAFALLLLNIVSEGAGTKDIFSPDKKIRVRIDIDKGIFYSVLYEGKQLLRPSQIALQVHAARLRGSDGTYTVTVCEDGVNADCYPSDYRMQTYKLGSKDSLAVRMAPGGGYIAWFRKQHQPPR
jgi:hypothetical protein